MLKVEAVKDIAEGEVGAEADDDPVAGPIT